LRTDFFRKHTPNGGGYLSIQDGNGYVKTKFLADGIFDFLNKVTNFISCTCLSIIFRNNYANFGCMSLNCMTKRVYQPSWFYGMSVSCS